MVLHNIYYADARVRRYAESLAEAGAQVDVLCLRNEQQPSNSEWANIRVVTIPLARFAQSIAGYAVEYLIALVLFTIWLPFLFARRRYEIIHVHNMPDFMVLAALIPRLLGARVILDIHDPMPEFYASKFSSQRGRLLEKFMIAQERLSARCAHALITANPTFREKLAKRGIPRDKITVVNNIPNSALFDRRRYERKSTGSKDNFVLIYPGTIAPRYGLEVAVRALPQLRSRIPNARLVIVGKHTPETARLARLAEELGVTPWLDLRRSVPHDQAPRLLAEADIGIYTGLSDPHMEAAVPTKVLEYAWMGLPIVASRLTVLEDMFDDSAILFFEPGNTEQFAQCVLRLYENPSLREELARRADEIFVQRHSWDHERQAYFDLLNQLLPAGQKLVAPD